MINLTRVIHYSVDDEECNGDYYSVELKDSNGRTVARWGDDYHDKGLDKAEGFIQGVEYVTRTKVKLTEQERADDET